MADPDVGLTVHFNPATFRQGVRFAMQMGAPPDADLRATFVFPSTGQAYRRGGVTLDPAEVRTDREGKPLDPTVQVIPSPPVTVRVDCAVEIQRAEAHELPVGAFRPSRAVVTLLDDDYAQVKGCREMLYNGDRYSYGYEPETNGLFSVGVHTVVYYARDDT